MIRLVVYECLSCLSVTCLSSCHDTSRSKKRGAPQFSFLFKCVMCLKEEEHLTTTCWMGSLDTIMWVYERKRKAAVYHISLSCCYQVKDRTGWMKMTVIFLSLPWERVTKHPIIPHLGECLLCQRMVMMVISRRDAVVLPFSLSLTLLILLLPVMCCCFYFVFLSVLDI